MDYQEVDELATEIYSSIKTVKFIKGITLSLEGPILKSKLVIETDIFINIFFNSVTKTTAFTIIKKGVRIFGIDRDNIRDWHKHDFDNPESHLPYKPTGFKEFLEEVSQKLEKILY